MSNNKQSMKLYTENDLIIVIGLTRHGNPEWSIAEIINDLTPIELPSDEEIEKGVNCSNLGLRYDYSMSAGFKKGAKWMRDKIQGGNK